MCFTYLLHLLKLILPWTAKESDMTLLFYEHQHNDTPFFTYTLNHSTCDIVPEVNLSKKIITYIHGWESGLNLPEKELMRELIETQTEETIIRVERPYDSSYVFSFLMVNDYGSYLGNFFLCLNNSYNYPLDNIRVIGHSLGAHMSGVAGKTCNGLLKSIMALDAAGPLFNLFGGIIGNRLAKTDAQTVELIHTSTAEGTFEALGKSDFYVNGGSVQPQCSALNFSCSHLAAVVYYTETILHHPYIGTRCPNSTKYMEGLCSSNQSAYMGGIVPDPKAEGVYYVTT